MLPALLLLAPAAGIAPAPSQEQAVSRHRFLASNLARQGFRTNEHQNERASLLRRRPAWQELSQGAAGEKAIALTFDDGPMPGHTERLLEVLKEKKVSATFFLIGNRVDDFPALARRIVEEGHEAGNHTYYHPNLTWLAQEEMLAEVLATSWTIERHTGFRPLFARAPGGQVNERVRTAFLEAGLVNTLWSVNPGDLSGAGRDKIVQDFARRLAPGAIVLLHEYPQATKEALGRMIDLARARGYRFVTLSELAPWTRAGQASAGPLARLQVQPDRQH